MIKKIKSLLREDSGMSLSEVLIAIGLSGLIAIGCAQIALASFNSAKYVENKALNTVNLATLNHTIVTDIETATGFIVHSANPTNACTSKFSTGANASEIHPLLTIMNTDGSSIGYELRDLNNDGSLWRVECGSTRVQNGSTMLLRRGLPIYSSSAWNTAVKCVSYPAGGSLQTDACPSDLLLNSLLQDPGIVVSIPATSNPKVTSFPSQIILAARNVA